MSGNKFSLYVKGDSFLHRLDPRAKIAWMVCGFVLVLTFNHPAFVGSILAITLALAFTARLPRTAVIRAIMAGGFIFFASVIVYPIYLKQGPLLFTFIGIEYTRDALLYALAVGMRLMTMTTISLVTIMTTTPSMTVIALEQLGLPYRGAVALSMMVRFLPTLAIEGSTIVEAQKSRALQLDKGNPIQRARKYAPIVIPLFIRSFLLAKQLGLALDARGFGMSNQRTRLITLTMSTTDKVFLIFWIVVLAVALIARSQGYGVVVQGLL